MYMYKIEYKKATTYQSQKILVRQTYDNQEYDNSRCKAWYSVASSHYTLRLGLEDAISTSLCLLVTFRTNQVIKDWIRSYSFGYNAV